MTHASHDLTDDGFHEIQLSGKQLVFLFMATTVVSVVIFLCGVWVGRGVRAQQLVEQPTEQTALAAAAPSASPSPAPAPISDDGPQAIDPPSPPTEAVELSYTRRLDGDPPPESIGRRRAEAAAQASRAERAEAPPPAEPPSTRTTARAAVPPPDAPAAAAGQQEGWVVQVHALRDRNTANTIVKRLASKGYAAFLVSAGPPTGFYRVQVGRFTERREAERTLERLKKEEKFEPWITR